MNLETIWHHSGILDLVWNHDPREVCEPAGQQKPSFPDIHIPSARDVTGEKGTQRQAERG